MKLSRTYNRPFPSSFVPVSKRVQVRNHSYKNDFVKVKSDHGGKFSNLSNWKEEARKKKIRTSTDSNP